MNIKKPREPEFMRELHKIREEMHDENKDLTLKEKIERTHKEVVKFLRSEGYKLIPFDKGYRMER
ncbi:MAG: hypothetical protein V1833_03445 [Elusimicrobiota bacterium]